MPIVNPWLFYLADVSNSIKAATLTAGCVMIIVFMIITFCSDEDEIIKRTRVYIIIGGVMVFVGLFFPKEETCYKMMAASLVTPENLQTVKGETQNVVNYIVEAVDQLLDDDEESK